MARCGCGDNACSCVVQGAGIAEVSGTGTINNPYVVNVPSTPVPLGCGLEMVGGDLQVAVQDWPFTCSVESAGSVITCDPATGQLFGLPSTESQFHHAEAVRTGLPLSVAVGAQLCVTSANITVDLTSSCYNYSGLLQMGASWTVQTDTSGPTDDFGIFVNRVLNGVSGPSILLYEDESLGVGVHQGRLKAGSDQFITLAAGAVHTIAVQSCAANTVGGSSAWTLQGLQAYADLMIRPLVP